MKKIAKTIVTIAALATISSASAGSATEMLAGSFYTAAALLGVTVEAPTGATAMLIVSPTATTGATIEAREEAAKIQAEIEVYDATGEVSTLLDGKLKLLKKEDAFKELDREELINLMDETTFKVLAGEELK